VDTSRPFQFQKRGQLFIGVHNEALPVATMRIRNPDRSPLRVQGGDAAAIPTGFAEIVTDDFPRLHPMLSVAPLPEQPG
jgi:hypothetical protein